MMRLRFRAALSGGATSSDQGPVRSAPWLYAVFLVILVVGSDLQFRSRDAFAALAGQADWQVLLELALWGLVGAWVLWRLLSDASGFLRGFPAGVGPALRCYSLVVGLTVVSALRTGQALSIVRTAQLVILLGLVLLMHLDVQRGWFGLDELWSALRRGIWALVVVAATITLLFPQLSPQAWVWPGILRYRWFATHPITTGMIIAVALLFLGGSILASRDRFLGSGGWFQMARWGMVPAFGVLLLITKTRGPLFAAALAALVLVVLSSSRAGRGAAILIGVVGIALVVGGAADTLIAESVVRGQTEDELLSLTGRDVLFAHGFELFQQRPLFGYGYLAARGVFLELFPWAGASHNAVLEVALGMGVIGLMAYLALFVFIVRGLWAKVLAGIRPLRDLAAEGLTAVVFLLVLGVVRESFGGPVGLEPALLMLAALIADQDTPRPATPQPGLKRLAT